MKHPIPDSALDDRLAFVGTAGSGKTFLTKGCVERLLARKSRVVVIDPLDVWYGLRLNLDGQSEAYPVAILGGRHADLPLTDHSGALIGEAVAKSTESCIVSLTGLKSSTARQRFMLAFLEALYEHTDPDARDPYHVVFDEADLWAPQKPMGQEAMLCHWMEEIVRRGRVKGFIPWFITQRPAVLNKNVLSQADGLVAMKLTASQDRNAIRAWVQSTADEGQWNDIDKQLPTFERGQGVLWLPGHGILTTERFPANRTFDSSRTPKRGEKKLNTALKPLDLPALKTKLAAVEEETKANDPKELRAQVAKLTAEKQQLEREAAAHDLRPAFDEAAIEQARKLGFKEGMDSATDQFMPFIREQQRRIAQRVGELSQDIADIVGEEPHLVIEERNSPSASVSSAVRANTAGAPKRSAPSPATSGDGSLTNPQRQLLQALAWWRQMGHDRPTRTQVAAMSGWKPKGSNLRNRLTELSSLGLIVYPQPGTVALTASGIRAAPKPDTDTTLIDSIRAVLTNPQLQLFEALLEIGCEVDRSKLAARVGWEPGGSNLRNRLTELSQIELIEYPQRGSVMLQGWVLS